MPFIALALLLAQQAAPAAPAFTAVLYQFALDALPLILIPLLAWAGKRLVAWVDAKTDNEMVVGVFTRLETHAEAVIRKRMMDVVDDLKEAAADGKITADELADALSKQKDGALGDLRELMTPDGLSKAQRVLGLDEKALAALLAATLESVLHKVKLQKTAAESAVAPLEKG